MSGTQKQGQAPELSEDEYNKKWDQEGQYQFVRKSNDPRFGEIQVYKKKGSNEFIFSKEKMTSAKSTAAVDIRELKSRMMLNRPNLQKMLGYSTSVKKELCSTNYFTQGFYEFPKSDLSKENSARVQGGNPYSEQELSHISSQALNGLSSLHQQKITHGDIRPQYLGYNKEAGDVQILDRLADPSPVEKTQASHIVGGKSPLYISPELYKKLQGKDRVVKYDPFKNDLYALSLSVLESGNGRPIKDIYNTNGSIDQGKLDGHLNDFSSKYRGDYLNNFLRSNLAKDESSRPTSTELVSRLGSYSSHSAYATPGQWNQTENQSWSTGQDKNTYGSNQGVNTFGTTGTTTSNQGIPTPSTTTTTSNQYINTGPVTTSSNQFGNDQVVNQANVSSPSFLKNDNSHQFYVENNQINSDFKKQTDGVKVNDQSTTLNTTQHNVSVQPTSQNVVDNVNTKTSNTFGSAQNVENVGLTKTATLTPTTQSVNYSQQNQPVQKTVNPTVNYSQQTQPAQSTVSYIQYAQPAQSTVSYIQPAQPTVSYIHQAQQSVNYVPGQSTVTYVQQPQAPVTYSSALPTNQTFSWAPQQSSKTITYVDAQPQNVHYTEQAPQQTVTYIQGHPESYSHSSQPATYAQSQPQTVTYVSSQPDTVTYVQSSPQYYNAPVHIDPITYLSSQPGQTQYIRQEQTVSNPIHGIDSGAKYNTSYVQPGDAKKSVIFSNVVIPPSAPTGFNSQRNVVSYVQNEKPAQVQNEQWTSKSEQVIPLIKEFSYTTDWNTPHVEVKKQNSEGRKSVSFINYNDANGGSSKYHEAVKYESPVTFTSTQISNYVPHVNSNQNPKSITYEEFLNLQKNDPNVVIRETHPETKFENVSHETQHSYSNPVTVTSNTNYSGPTTKFTNYAENTTNQVQSTPSYEKISETAYPNYSHHENTGAQEQNQVFQDQNHFVNYNQGQDEYQYSGHQTHDDHNYAQSNDAQTWTTTYHQPSSESQVTQGFSTIKPSGSDNIKVKRYRIENGNRIEITGSSYIS